MEEERLLSPCRQTSEVVKPPIKVLCLYPPAKKELNKSVDATLEELTSKAGPLSSHAIKFIDVCRKCTEITVTTSAPNLDSQGKDHDTKDDMQNLNTHSRGVDEILNLLDLMIGLWLMLDLSAMYVVKLSHITTWLREGSLGKKICQVPSEI